MRPIKFSKKECGLGVLSVCLALLSTRPSDPLIFIPMLVGAWLACVFLAYHHEGRRDVRWMFVVIVTMVLGFLGYRQYIAIPVTVEDIVELALPRTLAVSTWFAMPPLPGSAHIVATAFWVNSTGWAATCSQSLQGSTPTSGPILLPQIDPGMYPLGSAHVFMSGYLLPLNVARAVESKDGLVALLFVPQANMGFSLTPGPKRYTPNIQIKSVPFKMSDVLPGVGDKLFLYGAEDGDTPRFTPIEGTVKSRGHGRAMITIYSDIPYRTSYCGAPVIGKSKNIIGMCIGAGSSGDSEIIPALFISSLSKEQIRK